MTTRLSSKGQVVLPKQARTRLQLRPGMKLMCKVRGDSIVLTPETIPTERPRLVSDSKTGLRITKSPAEMQVTSDDVKAAMVDFP
jgi:AbrB family looped-hinge helix DNA binding protein